MKLEKKWGMGGSDVDRAIGGPSSTFYFLQSQSHARLSKPVWDQCFSSTLLSPTELFRFNYSNIKC